jgi:hypothetical protein
MLPDIREENCMLTPGVAGAVPLETAAHGLTATTPS